jgi:hypothetical protein
MRVSRILSGGVRLSSLHRRRDSAFTRAGATDPARFFHSMRLRHRLTEAGAFFNLGVEDLGRVGGLTDGTCRVGGVFK